MAFNATLFLDNDESKQFVVLDMTYEMSQSTDFLGIPRERVQGSIINLTIESSYRNHAISEWICSPTAFKDGSIVFDDVGNHPSKIFIFKNAYCIYARDEFHYGGEVQMRTFLRLSAMYVQLDDYSEIIVPGYESLSQKSNSSSGNNSNDNSVSTYNPNNS